MRRTVSAKVIPAFLCATLVAASPLLAEESVTCMSDDRRYRYCRARTDNNVRLVRQISHTRCRLDDNWGYDRNGVWVDRGCSAEFQVGRSRGHGDRDEDLARAAGAVAGVALVAALVSTSKSQEPKEVASWAVGTFRGYDREERTDVEITILPGGSVRGSAAGSDFTGRLEGTKLQAGRHEFRIERSGNGFEATDARESRHRVMFQRTGSGY
jgi:hypothetical protein